MRKILKSFNGKFGSELFRNVVQMPNCRGCVELQENELLLLFIIFFSIYILAVIITVFLLLGESY